MQTDVFLLHAANNFNRIFLNENHYMLVQILIEIYSWVSLKFILNSKIYNMSALVQVMAWPQAGNKPLSKLILTNLWVNSSSPSAA